MDNGHEAIFIFSSNDPYTPKSHERESDLLQPSKAAQNRRVGSLI